MEALAILPAIAALFSILTSLEDWRHKRAKRKANEASAEFQAALELLQTVNQISSQLGGTPDSEIDRNLRKDIKRILAKVQAMLRSSDALKEASPPEWDDEKTATDLKNKFRELTILCRKIIGMNKPIEPSLTLYLQSEPNTRRFCYGAILCQNGMAKAASLALPIVERPGKSRWGFICQHCNLEVGNYKSLRVKADGTVLEVSDLLAASHLMACDRQDMRAFYRCLACHLDQEEVDFATASELEQHMDKHRDFSFLPKQLESAGEKAAETDVEEIRKLDITATEEAADSEPELESQATLEGSERSSQSRQPSSANHQDTTMPPPNRRAPGPPTQTADYFNEHILDSLPSPPRTDVLLPPGLQPIDNSHRVKLSSPSFNSSNRRPVGYSMPNSTSPNRS